MPQFSERLNSLTARDVMTERLVVLHEADTIQHAANLFHDLHISGAPVVNSAGQPIGLLSMADVVTAVAARLSSEGPSAPAASREAEWAEVRALLNLGERRDEAGAGERVTKWMSRRVVSVRDNTRLVEVARTMCDGHWHRVTVVDQQGRLRGIVSTMDLLAAVVQASDEAAAK
jgi:CBS-domain-containing membrane protein